MNTIMNASTQKPKPRNPDHSRKYGENHASIRININSPLGNCYGIMGTASQYATQLGWDKVKIKSVIDEMSSGDYVNVCETFAKYFGDLAQLYYSTDYSFRIQSYRRRGVDDYRNLDEEMDEDSDEEDDEDEDE